MRTHGRTLSNNFGSLETIRVGEWLVTDVSILDNFHLATVTVDEWIERQKEWWAEDEDKKVEVEQRAREEFASAIAAVSQHPLWDGDLRCEPHVGYDWMEDWEHWGGACYFIFKLDNNGTTFIVSQFDPR